MYYSLDILIANVTSGHAYADRVAALSGRIFRRTRSGRGAFAVQSFLQPLGECPSSFRGVQLSAVAPR